MSWFAVLTENTDVPFALAAIVERGATEPGIAGPHCVPGAETPLVLSGAAPIGTNCPGSLVGSSGAGGFAGGVTPPNHGAHPRSLNFATAASALFHGSRSAYSLQKCEVPGVICQRPQPVES